MWALWWEAASGDAPKGASQTGGGEGAHGASLPCPLGPGRAPGRMQKEG